MPEFTIIGGPETWFAYEITAKSHLSAITRALVANPLARYFSRNDNGTMVITVNTCL